MKEIVNEAKAEFGRAKDRIVKGLATTPDDRLNWAPGPKARTPLHQVAHGAMAISGIQGMLTGQPMPFNTPAEGDAMFRKAESEVTTRQQALDLLEKNSAEYVAWLDTLTPEQVASTIHMPFGSFPMAAAITFPADHLRNHAAQIDYIQTCYGDFDWHMGG